MVEKLIRPKKPLPPHVLAAKLAGDTTMLSIFGKRGAAKTKQKRALRKIEAERKKRTAQQDLFADEVLAAEREAQMLADAERHAEANRIAWCDED